MVANGHGDRMGNLGSDDYYWNFTLIGPHAMKKIISDFPDTLCQSVQLTKATRVARK